ncbi:hypothetical protein SDRG_11929 [Saprolegnia diclina VS20]|uniref:Uncharacterized protein n=1 Tax=Saprolegnia diclina (strain VS20) TaxID=1156394 RepID=T0RK77_SAPDV|nr:hypothetical protein SDRG_11929 [Saprolegnia diclina VS20]EQC30352.1 hypothetical protein SDRG_11929 [Saprolegnia diclina VS20]|eukprot:XP_008616205.1 hypothetical protein SDRG_11929 [Saprolegnia diclina VS20]
MMYVATLVLTAGSTLGAAVLPATIDVASTATRAITVCSSLNGPHCFDINARNVPSYLLHDVEFTPEAARRQVEATSIPSSSFFSQDAVVVAVAPSATTSKQRSVATFPQSLVLSVLTSEARDVISIDEEDRILEAWRAYVRAAINVVMTDDAFAARWANFLDLLSTKPAPVLNHGRDHIEAHFTAVFGADVAAYDAIMTELLVLVTQTTAQRDGQRAKGHVSMLATATATRHDEHNSA